MDIEYVAKLARVELDAKQKKKFSRQLKDILSYIQKLKQLKLDQAEPMSHVLALKNVFRQDRLKPSLPLEKTLTNAPKIDRDSFSVPRIIE